MRHGWWWCCSCLWLGLRRMEGLAHWLRVLLVDSRDFFLQRGWRLDVRETLRLRPTSGRGPQPRIGR